ncbi:MAG: peptidoglycan-binding domain-containing protein [Hyphomicrobiales bacterium]|nr:peptidoglycan-binding domain-containing protein [Hyphomicrobiales bacterium]
MGRSARSLDASEPWSVGDAVATVLGLIARNPTLVGGSTAFLVALSFVSANALWYQPYAHSGAFFATRDFMRPGAPALPDETTILIERPEPAVVIEGDPMVKKVQQTLRDLNFYGGDVDGLYGPNTHDAIASYQTKMGLTVTGAVDDTLLDQLGTGSVTPVALPSPAPREVAATAAPASTPPVRDDRIAKVQVGLQEFGNEAIEADGLMGAKTEAAIREFQSLFGLPETGNADQAVYAKMKEIGLIK